MNETSDLGGRWYDLVVPLILLIMMISMGTELVVADFKRVLEMPRATLVGFIGQMLVLPLVGFAFAHWPGFSPTVAVGILIITACPGGATSNVFSYLAHGNVALSVTLTSLSSVACFATIPFWIGLGLDRFGGALTPGEAAIELPVTRTAIQLFVVTLLPVAVGMAIRARWPDFCARVRVPLRRSMASLMAATIVIIVGSEWEEVARNLGVATVAALVLVIVMLTLAHAASRALRIESRDAFTISIEVGLQNGALATMIVLNILQRPDLIVFPGAYAMCSLLPVAGFTWMRRRSLISATTA